MALLSNCACADVFAVFVAMIIVVITYFKWAFKYWERKNVPFLKPRIPFGTMGNPITAQDSFGEENRRQYEEAKAKGLKHVGLFGLNKPMYMPLDLEIIKNILTTDSQYFIDHGVYVNEKDDPLSAHLFSLEGAKWKNLRIKLTPTFTSGKMKMMFQTVVACSKQLQQFIDESCLNSEPIDVRSVVGRFTTDIIGSCGFGLDCNSFSDPNSLFRKHLGRNFKLTKWENFKGLFAFSLPNFSRFIGICITPKVVSDFILNIVKESVEYREKNNYRRNDFLQTLIDLKNDESQDTSLTIEEVSAQAFIFLIGGFETSSTTLSFCLYELANKPEIQQKLRDEINTVLKKHEGILTYDAIKDMKYLGQIVDETLRKYPPLPALTRKCSKDYKIPNTDTVIEKDILVAIPTYGLQNDAEYFPNPEAFDPDRFSDANKSQILPFTYMPFGAGPRTCIAFRFGLMQIKVGLCVMLQNFKFSINNRTKRPLTFTPASFILTVLGDIWLDVEKVQG